MSETVKVGYSIEVKTVDKIERIAEIMRWDKSTVVEAAVEELHKKLFSQPQPLVTVADAIAASVDVP